jgi:DNA-binding GntR family transcriptional regulator
MPNITPPQTSKVVAELPRKCMRDEIRRVIFARIHEGFYAPGTRLKELELAREFQVSQAPVREALRELEALGVLESERYRGTRVRAVAPDEMREAYVLRGRLEETAADLTPKLASQDAAALRALADASLSAARDGDLDAYARHNLEFHRMVVRLSGNAVLLRVWESLDWAVRMSLSVRQARDRLVAAARDHRIIAEALCNGRRREAGKMLREHAESFLRLEAEKKRAANRPGHAGPPPH